MQSYRGNFMKWGGAPTPKVLRTAGYEANVYGDGVDANPLTVTVPTLSWSPVWFTENTDAGIYRVTHISGAAGSRFGLWGIAFLRDGAPPSGADIAGPIFGRYVGVQVITTLSGAIFNASPLVAGRLFWGFGPFPEGRYLTEAEAIEANLGKSLTFSHSGGPLGMAFFDSPYSDNMLGTVPFNFTLTRIA
jgi:hypothetical protein